MTYSLYVDDNFHFMDTDFRYKAGEYERYSVAVKEAKEIVDRELKHMLDANKGASAQKLYEVYALFGDDPFISGYPAPDVGFSASRYARQRCEQLCSG